MTDLDAQVFRIVHDALSGAPWMIKIMIALSALGTHCPSFTVFLVTVVAPFFTSTAFSSSCSLERLAEIFSSGAPFVFAASCWRRISSILLPHDSRLSTLISKYSLVVASESWLWKDPLLVVGIMVVQT